MQSRRKGSQAKIERQKELGCADGNYSVERKIGGAGVRKRARAREEEFLE